MVAENSILTAERKLRIVHLRTALMTSSAIWALCGVLVLRLPGSGLLSIMGPVLSSSGAMGESSRSRRTRRVALNILCVGVLQFVQTNIDFHRTFSLLMIFVLSFIVHMLFKNALASSAIMVGSVLDLSFTPFIVSADIFITMAAVAVPAALSYYWLDRYFLGGDDTTGFVQSPPLSLESSLRRSLAFTLAYFFVKATDLRESHWILFTVGLAYFNGDIGYKARHIAVQRCFWAPFGLITGLLFLDTFGWQNYQLDYIAPGLGIFGYYISYRTGNYPVFYLIFLVMLTIADNITSGTLNVYDDSYNYVIQSTAMIFIGSIIVVLLEWRRTDTPNGAVCARAFAPSCDPGGPGGPGGGATVRR